MLGLLFFVGEEVLLVMNMFEIFFLVSLLLGGYIYFEFIVREFVSVNSVISSSIDVVGFII